MSVAVVGAGAWGKNLVRNLHEMGVLEAVAELSPQLRTELSAAYPDVTAHAEWTPVLRSDIPAVVVATPAPTHYEIAKAFLERDKDVFVEKPMTLSASEAQDLVKVAEARKRVLMVGHLLLYQPAVQWMRNAVESGMIGRLRSIHQRRLGLGRARSAENVLWSLGVHDIAVALYLVGGLPVSVDANGQCVLQSGIEDDVHLYMSFPQGVHTHLHCSWLWPERERGAVLVGEKGMLVYNELEQTVRLHRKTIDSALKNVDGGSEVVYQGSAEPLKLELSHFLDCVANRKAPLSDGLSGLEVVRVLQTASQRLNG